MDYYRRLGNHQKQILQPRTQVVPTYHYRSVIVLSVLKQVLIFMLKKFFVVSDEQILFKLVTLIFVLNVVHQEVVSQ